MMKKGIILLGIFTGLACSDPKRFEIKGAISGLNNETIYLEEITGTQPLIIDSVKAGKNGSFKFAGNTDNKTMFRINIANSSAIDLLIRNGHKVKIKGIRNGPYIDYEVKGSPGSEEIRNINRYMLGISSQVAELEEEYNQKQHTANKDSLVNALTNRYRIIAQDQNQYIKAFIARSQDPVLKIYASSYLNVEADFPYIDSLVSTIPKDTGSDYVFNFVKNIESVRAVSSGQQAPEINLPTPDGRLAALSSLKGKYVLIDFWASWCAPCRKENPNLVRTYNKFKDQGFMIYGVSLDRNKKAWEEAILKDGLAWIHVSDLKYWDSEAAKLYRIESIPSNLLLDKTGKIIAKNLHGAELDNFLTTIFLN